MIRIFPHTQYKIRLGDLCFELSVADILRRGKKRAKRPSQEQLKTYLAEDLDKGIYDKGLLENIYQELKKRKII